MILDTSALSAVVFREPDHERVVDAMAGASALSIGGPTLVETGIVLSARLGADARGLLSRLLMEAEIEVVAITEAHFGVAVGAWRRFGRGRHEASLNFGDCMSYATARLAERPLLCVGEDFAKTDIELA